MKMQKAELEFVTFESADVIATSGNPQFFFKGLGSDVAGDFGRNLSIADAGGLDVTDTYVYEGSDYKVANGESELETVRFYSLNPAGEDSLPFAETATADDLGLGGLKDGTYELSDSKFTPVQ